MDIPVYVIVGFLESGKTRFIKETLQNRNFTEKERTLIIACEQGEEEYEPDLPKKTHSVVEYVENLEDLNAEFFQSMRKKYRIDRVMIEYNGMWPLQNLFGTKLPANWLICQIIGQIDAQTFSMYYSNMKALTAEKLTYGQYFMFNRCDAHSDKEFFDKCVHTVNPRAEIDFVFTDGTVEAAPPFLPFNLDDPIIDIKDNDFAIWFMDARDDPEKYDGKIVKIRAMAYKSPKFPAGYFVPGRFVMTCCANDMSFMGFVCKMDKDKLKKMENDTWVYVTAKMKYEFSEAYKKKSIVLYAESIEPAEKPEEEVISMTM